MRPAVEVVFNLAGITDRTFVHNEDLITVIKYVFSIQDNVNVKYKLDKSSKMST